ncbi:conserved hypothetical protein [Neospora caninum Liverpool]|uniref:KH domain-containing protein n=1 Tax=Neospora caninum (strain Liverpool) TaxID=572307 RepID=F0VA59_NEOCL|nr:conserved hypothetical protein [Neospora caninum Liverpool]CBZ50548.1 conserved hypothetical protein [Neospora caninum Liverpool]CEL65158.1 TPA: hypothetical protein BN1204_010170 [Neospora caninum Liverpool]|eukprot:XP_003880581.1 conserved hypothetical protein [Neospora caninum Liverpool]
MAPTTVQQLSCSLLCETASAFSFACDTPLKARSLALDGERGVSPTSDPRTLRLRASSVVGALTDAAPSARDSTANPSTPPRSGVGSCGKGEKRRGDGVEANGSETCAGLHLASRPRKNDGNESRETDAADLAPQMPAGDSSAMRRNQKPSVALASVSSFPAGADPQGETGMALGGVKTEAKTAPDAALGEGPKEDKQASGPGAPGAPASSTSFSSDLSAVVTDPLASAPSFASSMSSFASEVGRELENIGSMSTAGSFKEPIGGGGEQKLPAALAYHAPNGEDTLASSLFFSALSFSLAPTPEESAHLSAVGGPSELTHPGKEEKDDSGTAASTLLGVSQPRRPRGEIPPCLQVASAASCRHPGSCPAPGGPREERNASCGFLSSSPLSERLVVGPPSQSLPGFSPSPLKKAFGGATVAASKGDKEQQLANLGAVTCSASAHASSATSLCVCKFLLGEDVAGYLVGRKGGGIDEFQKRNGPGLRVTVSKRGEIFPVLGERIAAAVGVQESIARALDEIVDVATKRAMHKEEERRLDSGRKIGKPKTCFKLVVPETSARLLEQQVENRDSAKELGRKHKTEVLITSANDWFHLEAGDAVAKERLVQVIGLPNDVKDTVRELVPLYQQDTTLTTSLELCYGKKTPAPPPPPPPVLPSLFSFTPTVPPPAAFAATSFLPSYAGSCFALANANSHPLFSGGDDRLLGSAMGSRGVSASLGTTPNALAAAESFASPGLGKPSALSRSAAFASGPVPLKPHLCTPLLSAGLHHAPLASYSTAVGPSFDDCSMHASQGLSGRCAEELPDVFMRTLNAAAPQSTGQKAGAGGKRSSDANLTTDILSLLAAHGNARAKLFSGSEGAAFSAYAPQAGYTQAGVGSWGSRNAAAAAAAFPALPSSLSGVKATSEPQRKASGGGAMSQAEAVRALLQIMGTEMKLGDEKQGGAAGRSLQKREAFEMPSFLGASLRDDRRDLLSPTPEAGPRTPLAGLPSAAHPAPPAGSGGAMDASSASRRCEQPTETGTGSEAGAYSYSPKRGSRGALLPVNSLHGSGTRGSFAGSGSGFMDAVGFLTGGSARDGRGLAHPLDEGRAGDVAPAASTRPGPSGENSAAAASGAALLLPLSSSRLDPSAPVFHPQQSSGEVPLHADENLQLLNSLLHANLRQRGGGSRPGASDEGTPVQGSRGAASAASFLPSSSSCLSASFPATPLGKRMRDSQRPQQIIAGSLAAHADPTSTHQLRNELLCLLRQKERHFRDGAEFQLGRGDASAGGPFCLPPPTLRGSQATGAVAGDEPAGRGSQGGRPEKELEAELALLQSLLSHSGGLPAVGAVGAAPGRLPAPAAPGADPGVDHLLPSSGVQADLQKLRQLCQGRLSAVAVKQGGRDEDSGWREGQRRLGVCRKDEREGGPKREGERDSRLPFAAALQAGSLAHGVFANSQATPPQPHATRLPDAWSARGGASSPAAATSAFPGGFGLLCEEPKETVAPGRGDGAGAVLPCWPAEADARTLASAVPRTSASTPTHRRSKQASCMQSLDLAFGGRGNGEKAGAGLRGEFFGGRRGDEAGRPEARKGENLGVEDPGEPGLDADPSGHRRSLSAQGKGEASLNGQPAGSGSLHVSRSLTGQAPFAGMEPTSCTGVAREAHGDDGRDPGGPDKTPSSSVYFGKGLGAPGHELLSGGMRGPAAKGGQEATLGAGPDEFSVQIQIPVSVAQSESSLSVLLLLLRSLSTRVSAVLPPAPQPASGRETDHAPGAETESPGTISLQVSGTADNVASASVLLRSLLSGTV